MKRLLVGMTTALMMMGSASVFAADVKKSVPSSNSFNMVEYLQSNNVTSEEEFESVILANGSDSAVESLSLETKYSTSDTMCTNDDFSYRIDEESQTIITTTKKSNSESNNIRSSLWLTTTEYEASVYSWCGIEVFTVTTYGEFLHKPSSFVDVQKSRGYFNPSFLSLWTGSEWTDTGNNYNNTKAYVETRGTANLSLSIADILGLSFNWQTANYALEVTCDTYGNTYADFDLSVK